MGAARIPIDTDAEPVKMPDVDREIREQVEAAIQHAGLILDASQRALLYESALHAIAMARRLRRDLDWSAEQASVFSLDHFHSIPKE